MTLSAPTPEASRDQAAYVSLAISLLVFLFKLLAYWFTGSIALLSDALESVINIAASVAVIVSVRLAQRPPDYEHPYGHHKAEYLSSAFEGSLIFVAALVIIVTSLGRLFNPEALEHIAAGVLISIVAAILNALLAWYLQRTAQQHHSVALAANARHVLTDVWTSLGVLAAVLLVALTGWLRLDALIAIAVALNIVREGWKLLGSSLSNLMDARLPIEDEQVILETLNSHPEILGYHRLRTRQAGWGRFAELDIFVEPTMTVLAAHDLIVKLENAIIRRLPNLITTIHVEPYVAGEREGAMTPLDEFATPSSKG